MTSTSDEVGHTETPAVGDYIVQRGNYRVYIEGPVTKITALSAMCETDSKWRKRDKQVPLKTILFSGTREICAALGTALNESCDRESEGRRQLAEQRAERDEKLIAFALSQVKGGK